MLVTVFRRWWAREKRWWAQEKLRRGRCGTCDLVLRDDNELGYCSNECWAVDRL